MSSLKVVLASVAMALALAVIGPLFVGAAPAFADGPHMMPSMHQGHVRFDPDRDHDNDRFPVRSCFNFCGFSNGCFFNSCFSPVSCFNFCMTVFNGCSPFNADCRMDARCFRFVILHDRDHDVLRDLRMC